jgi:ADP-ribose pyrophosphatase
MSSDHEREIILKGPKFTFERLRTRSPAGQPIERLIVRHPGAVCVLALLRPDQHPGLGDEPGVVMIRNDRATVGQTLWELPAGTIDPGEEPLKTASRELEEETGYSAGRIVPISRFYTTPGMTDEVMHAFLATDLRPVGQRLEPDESIQVHPVRWSAALEMADDGTLMDAKSMLTLFLAERRSMVRASAD